MTLVAEKETTRTTDAETTETNHGTMGVKRERERDSFAHSVKDAEPHTLVWIRALRLEHLKKHSHLSDPDGGELLLKICGRQPSRRERLKKTLPRCPWEESVDAYRRRLKAAAAHVNEMFDVDGLCRELPQRLKALRQTGGDRIAK